MIDKIDDPAKFEPLSDMTPMERFSYSLDKLGDPSLLPEFLKFLDNYEEFLAAKSHAELEMLSNSDSSHYRETAQHFDNFLHSVFASSRLDPKLVRYLII